MNYSIFLDTDSKQFLGTYTIDAERRLNVGDVFALNGNPTLYTVTREDPTNADLDETVNFYVRIQNTSPDSISMGRDIRGVLNNLAKARHG